VEKIDRFTVLVSLDSDLDDVLVNF